MTFRGLLREAWATALARRVPTVMVAVLAAAMCLTSLLTVGRTASAEAVVAERLEQAGSRLLTVADPRQQGLLTPGVVSVVAGLDTVESAVGLTVPRDMTSGAAGAGGPRVPTWAVIGDPGAALLLTEGRSPGPGEAIVAEDAAEVLGLDGPVGYLVSGDTEVPVVGTYRGTEPFYGLDAGAVLGSPAEGTGAGTLYVVIGTPGAVPATQAEVLRLVSASQPSDLDVRSPADLARLGREVGDELGAFGRSVLLLVLGAGAALTTVVVLADVLIGRTDLGRRRALGATRRTIVALVSLRTVFAAGGGAAAGAALGVAQSYRAGLVAPPRFVVGTVLLTLLTAGAAALAPAVVAAMRDPVRVLRTP